jgi:hypothetical protein
VKPGILTEIGRKLPDDKARRIIEPGLLDKTPDQEPLGVLVRCVRRLGEIAITISTHATHCLTSGDGKSSKNGCRT